MEREIKGVGVPCALATVMRSLSPHRFPIYVSHYSAHGYYDSPKHVEQTAGGKPFSLVRLAASIAHSPRLSLEIHSHFQQGLGGLANCNQASAFHSGPYQCIVT